MTRTDSKPTFEMTVDLNVLEHLGINLYSNTAAVSTEAVTMPGGRQPLQAASTKPRRLTSSKTS
ncbi:hypothetical protein P3T24_003699 [Paraburkholderia sp. GAS33]|uniref:hypothetical protein n=1 Tax=Paraburkholderia sp. GAS33 TaxID=3035130 RepID=UPI003D1FD815